MTAMTEAEAATAVLDLIPSDIVPRSGAPWERLEACADLDGSLSSGERFLWRCAAEIWSGASRGASVAGLGLLDAPTCAALLAVLAARFTPEWPT